MIIDDDKFNELPEWLKDQYEKTDEGYQSVDSLKLAKVKGTADNLDTELKGIKSQYEELNAKLTDAEQRKANEIKEAREKALEEATGKGEIDQVKELYAQKMADLEERSLKRGREEAMKEFKSESLNKDAQNMRAKLAAELARDEDSQVAIEMLLNAMIKPSDDGIEFYDTKGGALSINDVNVYKNDVLKKSPLFKHLIKADHVVSGAGKANGGAGGGSDSNEKPKLSTATQGYLASLN